MACAMEGENKRIADIRCDLFGHLRQAQPWPFATGSADGKVLRSFWLSPRVLQPFRSTRLHGSPVTRCLVDYCLLCRCNAGVQYRWRGVVVAGVRLATTRTGLWKKCLGYPRHPLVSLPPVHAADSLGHSPDGDHGSCTFICCTTHEKHLAGHRRPQFRQPALLPELD